MLSHPLCPDGETFAVAPSLNYVPLSVVVTGPYFPFFEEENK
jgi:hypothetical protein